MKRYSKSRMDTFYKKGDASLHVECIVEISDDALVLMYRNTAGEFVEYVGEAQGPGHYLLRGKGFPSASTLHRIEDYLVLEGSYDEDGELGMWRILLKDE